MINSALRICPVCETKSVGLSALAAAAVDSTARCAHCGSGLAFNWVSGLIETLVALVALGFGLAFGSVWAAAIAGLATWPMVLLSPLKPDDDDPITFRQLLRRSRKQSREDS